MSCGRVRKGIDVGWTQIIDDELENLKMGVLNLPEGMSYSLKSGHMEYAIVLVYGECFIQVSDELEGVLGPRKDPFSHLASALFLSRDSECIIEAKKDSLIGIGQAPAKEKIEAKLISPNDVKVGHRGVDNWSREVRFVCWSDNTKGNLLIAGETVTPSGNWSTIPPHRHDYYKPGEEVPYEEIYFFQFSRPQGYGLIWQFDDDRNMDQAFSLKSNDAAYMSKGYHPTVCGPGSQLYHLTYISGPYRKSQSSVHKDYEFLLEQSNMDNPFRDK